MADLSVVVYGKPGVRGVIQPPVLLTLTATPAETLHVLANTVSAIRGETGQVAFYASPDHATLTTGYTAQLRVSGSSTVVDSEVLGTPTPDGNNVIIVDLASFFGDQTAGTYTLSILSTDAGGSTDSAESAPFSLPLP